MKNYLFTTIACLLCIIQTSISQNKHSIGLSSGLAIANQKHEITDMDYTIETSSIMGNVTKLVYNMKLNDDLNFVSKIGYIRKGSKTEFESLTVNHLQNDDIIVNTGDLKSSTYDYLSFDAGVQYILLATNQQIYAVGMIRIDKLLNYDTESDYEIVSDNEYLLGIDPAIGIKHSLAKIDLFAEFQYLFDVIPVMDSKGIKLKNRASVISFGCLYNLSK